MRLEETALMKALPGRLTADTVARAPSRVARRAEPAGAALRRPGVAPLGTAAPTDRHGVTLRRTSRPRHRLSARRRKASIAAMTQPDGPHVRLGIVWAAITLAAVVGGPGWLAGWLTIVAALAAGSGARSWAGTSGEPTRNGGPAYPRAVQGRAAPSRNPSRRVLVQPPVPITAALAAIVTLSSLAGWTAVGLAAGGVTLALVAGAVFGPLGRPDALRRVLIVLLPSLAGASLVLARAHGLADCLVLAGMATVYDSSAYLIGTGAPNRWEGQIAGVASIAALTLFVAAVLVPPFSGSSPWILGLLAAVGAPLGPAIGRRLVAEPSARVPALRRLDSLFVLGPVWATAAAGLLHH